MSTPQRNFNEKPEAAAKPAANADETNIVRLLRELVESARLGADATAQQMPCAAEWPTLDREVQRLIEARKSHCDGASLDAANQDLVATARALLEEREAGRGTVFEEMALDFIERWTAWAQMAPHAETRVSLHAALVWFTVRQLLAVNYDASAILTCLDPPKARRWQDRVPTEQVTALVAHGVATLRPAVTSALRKSADTLARTWMAGVEAQRHVADVRRARRDAEAAAAKKTSAQPLKAAQRVATTASAKVIDRPAPDTQTVPIAKMALDGAKLRGSVFWTWLGLVLLSWVSLIWGTLLSIPFTAGLSLIVSATVGIFVVPVWGTLWGFLGMGTAQSQTLRQMGFAEVPKGDPLRRTCETYAASLGIPCPQLGLIPQHNAFAMGTDADHATVAIGKPLLQQLRPDEVDAVLGHELGHVVSGDMRRMMLMRTFQNACVWFGFFQGLKIFARWIICWAAELSILWFSRHREYHADAIGAALAGKEAMIGALQKMQAAPALTRAERTHARFMFRGNLMSTHPSFEQRIAALESETYLRKLPLRRS